MLHIVNGESTAKTLKSTKNKGQIFSFKDALITGPAPATKNRHEFRAVRAEHLAQSYGVKSSICHKDLVQQDAVLESTKKHDEVVLWFEHDLFCQLNLLYLLDWFNQANLQKTKISLINIGQFPGRKNFRGLGELTPDELTSLFSNRELVTAAQLTLASKAWQAFCSPNPTGIELLLHGDTSALPALSGALTDHLNRFPSTTNGLGRIEKQSLQFIDAGLEKFAELFPRFTAAENSYGLGDAQLWTTLFNLSTGPQPLLTLNTAAADVALKPEFVKKAAFKLTKTGRAVLAGKEDLVSLNGIDQWLGGVHLHGKEKVWRWHDPAARLALV
jgi:hypothetical protein